MAPTTARASASATRLPASPGPTRDAQTATPEARTTGIARYDVGPLPEDAAARLLDARSLPAGG